ncbi:MAG: NmrA family NAD(P)-binding protein [Streptosporangiaceae bacterium]|nr:NmrA family NAD(P)-binding protein [Streptosporangiaceae bacterium]
MILVIGGGSRTGRELLRLLRGAGARLRVLTREAGPADGPDTVVGDLGEPGTLDRAMAGVDKVFLLCSAAPRELAWHQNAIDAAARAGVALLVRSSILAASPDSPSRFIRDHGRADEHLRASGVPYTIVRPNFYMHNVTALWPAALDQEGNYYAPAGDARISMVDARDVAAVAARALTGDGHSGKVYDVTGPEALGHAEACRKLGSQLGRPVRYVPVEDAVARSAMLSAGVGGWLADGLVELYQDYRRSGTGGYAAQVHSTVLDVTGAKPRTLDEALAG